jgi:superfamily II DNA or RNA helicase
VLRSTTYEDCTGLWLTGIERTNAATRRTVLLPFETIERHREEPDVRAARGRQWCRTVRRRLWEQHPFGSLDALVGAGIDLHPYQLEPTLALHRHGHLRILIADAVGLGKTIQAAAALAQLTHDEPAVRILVVCPAGLRTQWRTELADRFRLDASICDLDWLADARRELPPGVNPWSLPGIFIASVDLIKRPEVIRDLEALHWDLAVFDEAHGLSPGTARLAAARVVADRSRRVLMLTATPPEGDPDQMAALTTLGQGAAVNPVVMFRRTRMEVGFGIRRRSTILPLRLSDEEAAMHRLLETYTAAVWREAAGRGETSGRLLSILLRKRALSSAGSLASSVSRRLLLLAQGCGVPPPIQTFLPLGDDETVDDAPTDGIVGAAGLADVTRERPLLEAVLAAATKAALAESKIRVLLRFLRRAGEPAIVFTEYRDTLERLASAMRAGSLQLHGGMLPEERDEVQARFAREGGVLLATDAASEGLNLHHRCRLVVHFELPWNPMRLEQRIGRVDRLGQRSRVHEVLLVARHTAERLVLVPLVRRVRAAQAARSTDFLDRLSESEVAEAILGDRLLESRPLAHPTSSGASFRAEARLEAVRLALVRRAGRPGRTTPLEPILYWRRTSAPVATVVMRATGETAAGRLLGCVLVPLRLELDSARHTAGSLRSPEQARALLRRCQAQLTAVVEHRLSLSSPWEQWPRLWSSLMQREREIRSAAPVAAVCPVQAGLFDRRVQAAADARHQATVAWHEQSDARLAVLAREEQPRLRVDVVAICSGCLDGP